MPGALPVAHGPPPASWPDQPLVSRASAPAILAVPLSGEPSGSAALLGMEKKVQQLTKVIYHLNAKGEDAADTSDAANNYENEIEGILRDAGERVKRFQAACSHQTDMKLIEQKVREVEMKYEGQKQRALRDFEEYKRRSSAAQVGPRPRQSALGTWHTHTHAGETNRTLPCPMPSTVHG